MLLKKIFFDTSFASLNFKIILLTWRFQVLYQTKKDYDTKISDNENKIPGKSSFEKKSELTAEIDKFSILDENQFLKKV